MSAKILILLLLINFITTSFSEDQNTSEELRNIEEESEDIEDTTFRSEEDEDLKTTTSQIQEVENAEDEKTAVDQKTGEDQKTGVDQKTEVDGKFAEDDELKNREDVKRAEEDEERVNINNVKIDLNDGMENSTDDNNITVTEASVSGDVDLRTNLSNIGVVSKTEPTLAQTTTKLMEEEQPLAEQPKEQEIPGPRNPKAENDYIIPPPPQQNLVTSPRSARELVRDWLSEQWIRGPIGILVPMRAPALSRALAVWSDLDTSTLQLSRVSFMAYDDMGVCWRSKHNIHPTSYTEKTVKETLSKLILKYQDVNTDTRKDGTMRALISAAKLVPYDGALIVFTDQGGGDNNKYALALRAVVEKRLKVYTVWTGPNYPGTDNEGLMALRNISKHTEGDITQYPLQIMGADGNLSGEAELEQWNPLDPKQVRRGKVYPIQEQDKYDTLVVRRGGGQAISLGIPVENGVTALRIFIEGAVEHAVLYPPNDAPQIALYNLTSIASFSSSSTTESFSPREVYLVFPGSTLHAEKLRVIPVVPPKDEHSAYIGMWHLSVRCDTCDYRLCVSARGLIHFDVDVAVSNVLKFKVTGPVASIRESQLVDEYGNELAKLSYSYQPIVNDGQNTELPPEVDLVAEIPLPEVKGTKVYAKIVGRDTRGEPFVRLSGPLIQPEVRMGRSASIVTFPDSANDLERVEEYNAQVYNTQQQQQHNNSNLSLNRLSQVVNQQGTLLTSTQIGLASRLYGSPGESLQLHFEVTNHREQTIRFSFGASGELRFLTGINPRTQNISPGQTVNVIVGLLIPNNIQPGSRDMITFTAYGTEQTSMSAYVYVANQGDANDVWAPEVRHTFQGTCIGRTGDDCAQHTWAATIIARDNLSGLLRISSSPIGILYNGEFISGTRQEVTATYRATCCAPRVLINAVDANGNANTYIIDISGYLNEAAIAAIVLGVFLFIALVALLVFLIYWCVKKRRESRELPSYNTRT